MSSVVVAKFGGSTIGVDGISIPVIIQRISSISKNAKVIAVFSAPLTVVEGKHIVNRCSIRAWKQSKRGKNFRFNYFKKHI